MRKPAPEYLTNISLHDVYRVVEAHSDLNIAYRCRKRPYLALRAIFYSLSKDFVVDASLNDIADMVKVTHATVINALNRMPKFLSIPKYRKVYNDCHETLMSITKITPIAEEDEIDLSKYKEPFVDQYERELNKVRTQFHIKERELKEEIDRLKTQNIVLKNDRASNPVIKILDMYDHDPDILDEAADRVRTLLHRNEVRKRERARFNTGTLKTV